MANGSNGETLTPCQARQPTNYGCKTPRPPVNRTRADPPLRPPDEESDFILDCDIKYRLGGDTEEEE
jgi:hypothetical protein